MPTTTFSAALTWAGYLWLGLVASRVYSLVQPLLNLFSSY